MVNPMDHTISAQQPIRVDSAREVAEIVVEQMRRSGHSVPDEAITHIEREIVFQLAKIKAAGKVSRMVRQQVGTIFGDMVASALEANKDNGPPG